MNKARILISAVIVLAILFIGFRCLQMDTYADIVRPLILPLVLLHFIMTSVKRGYFFFFLLLYALGDLLGITYYIVEVSYEVDGLLYYMANCFYIASYISLIVYIFRLLDMKQLIKRLSLYIFILFLLDVYCVVLVTNIAFESEILTSLPEYVLEFSYNAVIMALLTVALLNYLSKDSKKALYLFIGSVLIVFSEVIQVAYFYVAEMYILNVIYSLFLALAFLTFIVQFKLKHKSERIFHSIEKVTG